MGATLAEVPVGETFTVWYRKFTILDKADDHVFAIETEIDSNMLFTRRGNRFNTHLDDFRTSDVKDYLNSVYLEKLKLYGADIDRDLVTFDIDLKGSRGQPKYGFCAVKAGLLTLEQYKKYSNIIPCFHTYQPWWLATPWKTFHPSMRNRNGTFVTTVNTYNEGCAESFRCSLGVRPVLALNPSLQVNWENGLHEGNALSDFSTDELLEELLRRTMRVVPAVNN